MTSFQYRALVYKNRQKPNISRGAYRGHPPSLLIMTDDNRPALQPAIWPKEAMLVLRGRARQQKPTFTGKLSVAENVSLAIRYRASSIHLSNKMLKAMGKTNIRLLKHRFFITAAAHDIKELYQVQKIKLNAAVISPVFHTASHPDGQPLGILKLRQILIKRNKTIIYAMGGVNLYNARILPMATISGLAGVNFVAQLQQKKGVSGG